MRTPTTKYLHADGGQEMIDGGIWSVHTWVVDPEAKYSRAGVRITYR